MAPGYLAQQPEGVGTIDQVSLSHRADRLDDRSFFPENYWRNPQYLVRLHAEHDTNDDQLCTMIIFLSIKKPHERQTRRAEDDICFQFRVYKVSCSDDGRDQHRRLSLRIRSSMRARWMKVWSKDLIALPVGN